MSVIAPIDDLHGYAPETKDELSDNIEPVMAPEGEPLQVQQIRAADEQANHKASIQGFQYTGKGSFIDKVF